MWRLRKETDRHCVIGAQVCCKAVRRYTSSGAEKTQKGKKYTIQITEVYKVSAVKNKPVNPRHRYKISEANIGYFGIQVFEIMHRNLNHL